MGEMKFEGPRIHHNALGRFVIVHPTFPLAWSGKTWVPAINGIAVAGVQIANFETEAEAFTYWTEHSDAIEIELSAIADEIARQVIIEAAGGGKPNHWADPPPDPNAFRCPICGSWRPPYGISGNRAEVPGMGAIDFMNFYCGECRAVIAIHVMKNEPGLSLGLPSLPPGFNPRKH
jgi:hypothetical protein